MEYDPIKKAFHCHLCEPNEWKHIYTSVLVDEETGDIFCIVHPLNKIGHYDLVPDWRQDGNTGDDKK